MIMAAVMRHAAVLARRARILVVRQWRRSLRAVVGCAAAAAVIALVFVVPPTIAGIVTGVRHARMTNEPGGLTPTASLREVTRALQASGGTGLVGNWWLVTWETADAHTAGGGSRAFTDEPAARRFAEQVGGSVTNSAQEFEYDSRGIVVLRPHSVITDKSGNPVIEVVAVDGRLLYRSPDVPVAPGHAGPITPDMAGDDREGSMWPTGSFGPWAGSPVPGSGGPDTAVCEQFDAEYWGFGHGVLRGVEPLSEGMSARICVFRTAEQVRNSQLNVVRWALIRAGDSFVGYWAMALPVVAVGGLVIGRFRGRVRQAAQADTPVLVDNPRPHGLLGGITDDVNHSLSRARMSVEQQRTFVADAAHELRSPLASLITTLEVADRHPGIVDPQQVTRTSLTQARRLERLTQDLLLLAQVDARARLREDVVDLADVIREVAADTPEQGRPVRLTGVTATEVIGDREAFRRVLRNLVDNAVRHAASTVDVTLSVGDGRARVEVANDGAPIPDDRAEQIFDRFTRLDDARARDAGGSGLGLAIARGVTERYGGTVAVLPGRIDGATFVWELPLAR